MRRSRSYRPVAPPSNSVRGPTRRLTALFAPDGNEIPPYRNDKGVLNRAEFCVPTPFICWNFGFIAMVESGCEVRQGILATSHLKSREGLALRARWMVMTVEPARR